ncbi:MAG TPA: sugar ABC transporter substrate-binding protein [Baekduia sp.]|uniref:sugar ABC transporter substrate-binding protein n=1 Tax=Baekduia sp. TaxID=2600305 RepID=UPI002D788ACB|nr:sugar ABC transporter substrate-binding protein [Baekduia sp.]HET6509090.1 sugar ABC transporter substrate-binding protein [Baekduia sp.]
MTARRLTDVGVAVLACAFLAAGISACGSSDATSTASGGASSGAAPQGDTTALRKADSTWATGTPPAREQAFAKADNGKKVRIAYFVAAAANPFWAKTTAALQEVAKARNATVKVFDGGFDPAKQQSQMQDALTSGRYDAFVVVPVANTNLIPIAAQAKAKKVPVVVTGDFPLGPRFDTVEPQVPGVVGVAMTPPQSITDAVVEGVLQACKGIDPCEIAQISGGFKLPVEANIYKSLQAGVAKIPGGKIVAREEGGYLVDPARTAMQNILTAHPAVDVVMTTSDAMAAGAETAIKQGGKLGKIKLNGDAGSQEGVAAVRDGRWFMTALQLPYDNGLYAGDLALRAARGQTIDDTSIDTIQKSGLEIVGTKVSLAKTPDFSGQWKNG